MAAEWQRPLNWSPNGKVFFPLRLRIRRSVEPPPVPRSTAQQPGPLANQQLLWSPLSPKAGGATENQILIARSATTRCPAARPFQARDGRGGLRLARCLGRAAVGDHARSDGAERVEVKRVSAKAMARVAP